jgi:hypothetical protein
MLRETRRSCPDDEYLVLGRALMDTGFRDLFLHDPEAASARLEVRLASDAIQRIRRRLDRIEALNGDERARFSSALTSFERWKQQ